MLLRILGFGVAIMSAASAVSAGAVDDAREHFNAIAAGDVTQIMLAYGDQPSLQWVGGPLNGVYNDADKIREVWTKYARNNTPAMLSVTSLEENGNPAGATVTANVIFKAQNEIKVRYVLVYRKGKLVSEVWQIDPQMM